MSKTGNTNAYHIKTKSTNCCLLHGVSWHQELDYLRDPLFFMVDAITDATLRLFCLEQ